MIIAIYFLLNMALYYPNYKDIDEDINSVTGIGRLHVCITATIFWFVIVPVFISFLFTDFIEEVFDCETDWLFNTVCSLNIVIYYMLFVWAINTFNI